MIMRGGKKCDEGESVTCLRPLWNYGLLKIVMSDESKQKAQRQKNVFGNWGPAIAECGFRSAELLINRRARGDRRD